MKNIIKSQIIQESLENIKIKIVKNNFYNQEDSRFYWKAFASVWEEV